MSKTITQFVCQQCGRTYPRALGKCPQCGGWDTMVEEVVVEASSPAKAQVRGLNARSQPRRMGDISGDAEMRIPLPIGEFARVLGGGVVPGSIVLVGGDPGIGKSTLLLQMALELA
jgi:DNA repair protein RadA/Sms